MAEDARFEDGGEQPLNLGALDLQDLEVLSSLVQDAVLPVTELKWDVSQRRFALLVNRFRWEDEVAASLRKRKFERVQSVLLISDVMQISSQGINRSDEDLILSILSLEFEGGEDGTGRVIINLAGDGAIACDVETLDIRLKDVTRPYVAPSKSKPSHA